MEIVMTADLDTSTVFVTMALIAMTAKVALFKLTSKGSVPHLQTSTATSRHQYTHDDFNPTGIRIALVMLVSKCAIASVLAVNGNTPLQLECAGH